MFRYFSLGQGIYAHSSHFDRAIHIPSALHRSFGLLRFFAVALVTSSEGDQNRKHPQPVYCAVASLRKAGRNPDLWRS